MKRKKLWIIFGSVIASVVVLCVIFALVFRLKTVDIEFRTRVAQANTNLGEDVQTKVLESGEFEFGKNILFMNFDENIKKIEKSNPYVKVEQVIRSFPNIVRVYISERIPKYRIKDSSEAKWYILDTEFKILDKIDEASLKTEKVNGNSNFYDQTIEITTTTLTLPSCYIGDFVESNIISYLSDITSGIYGKTKDFTVVKSIEINQAAQSFLLTMRNTSLEDQKGCKIDISGYEDLYKKALAAAVCFNDGQIVDNASNRFENIPETLIQVNKNDEGYYCLASTI